MAGFLLINTVFFVPGIILGRISFPVSFYLALAPR